MTSRVKRHVSISMSAWLLLVWVAVFGSLDPLVVVGGLVIAVAVQLLFPLPTTPHLWHLRILPFLWLLIRFNWDLVTAGIHVAWLVVSGKDHRDGIVRCDLRTDNPVYMTIVAAMTSMVPGTIVVEASKSEKALFLHVLDLDAQGGVEGVRKSVAQQEDRVLWAVAPSDVLVESGLKGVKG